MLSVAATSGFQIPYSARFYFFDANEFAGKSSQNPQEKHHGWRWRFPPMETVKSLVRRRRDMIDLHESCTMMALLTRVCRSSGFATECIILTVTPTIPGCRAHADRPETTRCAVSLKWPSAEDSKSSECICEGL